VSYHFADVREPHIWYLKPEDLSLFGISAAYRRNKWRFQLAQGTHEVPVPMPPKATQMSAAVAVHNDVERARRTAAAAAAAGAAGAVAGKPQTVAAAVAAVST
jgi:hypothetical protein